jgi:hypothetical protein
VVGADGRTRHGSVSGAWTRLDPQTYRIVWNYVFVDRMTLSPDGRNLAGRNQLGFALSATRRPCSG